MTVHIREALKYYTVITMLILRHLKNSIIGKQNSEYTNLYLSGTKFENSIIIKYILVISTSPISKKMSRDDIFMYSG